MSKKSTSESFAVQPKEYQAMQRAALYIRVSTEEQAMHGYSLEAQREALTKYAKNTIYSLSIIMLMKGKARESGIISGKNSCA